MVSGSVTFNKVNISNIYFYNLFESYIFEMFVSVIDTYAQLGQYGRN